jgi:hypothetical protein
MRHRLPTVWANSLGLVRLFLRTRLRCGRNTGPTRIVAKVPPVYRRHRPDEEPPSAVLAASIDRRDPTGPYRSLENAATRPIEIPAVPPAPDKWLSRRNRRVF